MTEWLEKHLVPCFFKSTFGIECPGCGMQRAFIALLKGNLSESLHMNPSLIPFLITLAVLGIQLKIKHPKGGLAVMWLFIITMAIALVHYAIKQFALFKSV